MSEYCATIVPQLPSKAPSAYAYLVAVIDTSAPGHSPSAPGFISLCTRLHLPLHPASSPSAPDSLAFYVKDGNYLETAIIVKGDLLNVQFYSFDWEERKWFFIRTFLMGKMWGAQWQTLFDYFTEEKEGDFGGVRPLTYVNAIAKVRRLQEPKNYILDVCVIKGIGVTSWPGPDCIFGPSDASEAYDDYYSSNDNDLMHNPKHPYRSMLVHFERDGEVLYDVWPSPDGNVVGRTTGLNPSPSPIERGTDAVYDLQGRRLNAVPEKGMYIQGGKMRMAW